MSVPESKPASSQAALSDTRFGSQTAKANSAAWRWRSALVLLPLACLWFRLLNNLRLEWATDPQYGYGFVVPILCLGLLVRRWHRAASAQIEIEPGRGKVLSPPGRSLFLLLVIGLAILYLPTRLVVGATPEWRPIQWLLGIEVVGLTLCTVYIAKGSVWLRQLAFPICLFFVAIPWPTPIEAPIIQGLTRLNAGIVVEVLGITGIPAAQHGNLIEVATGVVGIDDACSGIRSFQSSLMISLFLGEFYWLSRRRRWLLIPASFLLAITFNVCRTTILTLIAARKGTAAIAEYHDTAGMTILLACFATTWGVALLFASRESKAAGPLPSPGIPETAGRVPARGASATAPEPVGSSMLKRFALGLLVWLVVVETGVGLWYRVRESQLRPGPNWSMAFPVSDPSFKPLPIPDLTRRLLRYDDGKQGQWNESDGKVWQAFYFDWLPGRVAGYLAKRHTPEACLTAVGCALRSGPELVMLKIHGVVLPMRCYVFDSSSGPLNVYQCRWEAGAEEDAYVVHEAARYNLIRAVWAGRGDQGQKVLELVGSGFADPEEARQAMLKQLEKLIKLEGIHASAKTSAADAGNPQP